MGCITKWQLPCCDDALLSLFIFFFFFLLCGCVCVFFLDYGYLVKLNIFTFQMRLGINCLCRAGVLIFIGLNIVAGMLLIVSFINIYAS